MLTTLGSGQAEMEGVATKAALLDRARHAGLPVPPGLVIPHGTDGRGLAVALAHQLRGWPVRRVAVRSAFPQEDGLRASNAGRFRTVLDVPAGDPGALADAIGAVRASGEEGGATRLDVLALAMVPAVHAGVLFTERAYEDDLVNMVQGLADRLVAGEVPGERMELPKLRWAERPAADAPPWARRLQRLMRRVRRVFGEADLDIEWADDGRRCWLLQVRPVTVPPRRDEVFTLANHREILPPLPSALMTSLIASSSHDLLGFYGRIDRAIAARPYVEVFAGRPYLNLSQLTDLLRVLGLPTGLVAEAMGGSVPHEVGMRPLRLLRHAPTLVQLGASQLGTGRRARRAAAAVQEIAAAQDPDPSFGDVIDRARRVHVTIVHEMSSLATAATVPVSVLRRLGVLADHAAGHRTASTQVLDDLAPLAAAARHDPVAAGALRAGRVPDRPEASAAFADWLDRHGHRGVYESDLSRPRYAEDPAPILRAAADLVHHHRLPDTGHRWRRRALTVATRPIWWWAAPHIEARETFRSEAMRAFQVLREQLLELGADAAWDELLPEPDAVWDLEIDRLRGVDLGHGIDEHELGVIRKERARLAGLRLPDVRRRFDPITESRHTTSGLLTGMPLTRGRVRGRALVADEPPSQLPPGDEPLVLLARAIDPGWVPVLGRVAAVAVAIGGDLSHGSIIVRELGLPAVTNLGEALLDVPSGSRVELDADAGTLRVLDPVRS
jgi:rifampicin phosphotransferase